MSTSMLYHTQGICDFQHKSAYYPKEMIWDICRNPKKFKCPACSSSNVRTTHYGYRNIRGMPMGAKTLTFRVKASRKVQGLWQSSSRKAVLSTFT